MANTKTITLAEVIPGMKLPDCPYSEIHGQYINWIVESVKITKAGRIKLKVSGEYRHADGTMVPRATHDHSNGALAPTGLITIVID